MEDFRVIGYYITEVIDMPVYLRGLGDRMLSVSSCLGEMHPKMKCYFVNGWREKERLAYQKRMGLNDKQYFNYTKYVKELFDSRRLDTDSRFLRLSDAEYFYKKFCSTGFCRLVSVSTTSEYFELLAEELAGENGNSNRMVNGEPDRNRFIGYDILGWDVGGFHSFLCNLLQRELPKAEWNEIGLLKNDFGEVAQFADRIQGMGEPVEWIPCRIGECEGFAI